MDPELKMHESHGTDFAGNGITNGKYAGAEMPSLQQVRTEGSITITPEMFERMYLAPENKVKGDLRRMVGNPTPLGLGGFLVAYSPIIFSILGWRGSGRMGAATVGTYFFSGGLLAILASIMEWILGNSFPSVFFGVYGGYFLAYGATIVPDFGAYLAYNPSNPQEGLMAPGFLSGLAFWNVMVGIFTVFCTICALRTNILFFLAFLFLALTFLLVGGSFWIVEEAKTQLAHNVQIAGGACGFVTMVIGWYLLLALMLSTVDFPINLPVGDLSTVVKGGAEMRNRKARKADGDVEKQA